MSGVATVAQIVSLVNRTPAPSASADTNTETKTS